jgi:hypothetical protein
VTEEVDGEASCFLPLTLAPFSVLLSKLCLSCTLSCLFSACSIHLQNSFSASSSTSSFHRCEDRSRNNFDDLSKEIEIERYPVTSAPWMTCLTLCELA